MRGQVANEVVAVIGIAVVLAIPLLFGISMYSASLSQSLEVEKADAAATRLARMADAVIYMGPNSSIVEEITVPAGVSDVRISGREIVFVVETSWGKSEIVKMTEGNVSGSVPSAEGSYFVEVKKGEFGDAVKIALR